jgi:hypothetical protein
MHILTLMAGDSRVAAWGFLGRLMKGGLGALVKALFVAARAD